MNGDYTLVGVLVAAVGGLFVFTKALVDLLVKTKDAEIADLRERVDRYEALVSDLLDVAQTAQTAIAKREGK